MAWSRRAGRIPLGALALFAALPCAACKSGEPTATGTIVADWHRSSALSDIRFALGADLGEVREETWAGALRVGDDAIALTVMVEVSDMQSPRSPFLPDTLRGARRVRVRVDDAAGRRVRARCKDALGLTPSEDGRRYQRELTATCTLRVAPDGIEVTFTHHATRGLASDDEADAALGFERR